MRRGSEVYMCKLKVNYVNKRQDTGFGTIAFSQRYGIPKENGVRI